MTTFTGYLVSLDVGSDGLGKSDEISSCSGGCHIFFRTQTKLLAQGQRHSRDTALSQAHFMNKAGKPSLYPTTSTSIPAERPA